MHNEYEKVNQYIDEHFSKTIRTSNPLDETLLQLPNKYIVMSIKDTFQEMYYWDTYFTMQGLLVLKEYELTKDILFNFAYLVETYGYIPNGNRTYFLKRSQPPYFSLMVRDYFEKTNDLDSLKKLLPVLEKEYNFWMTKRNTIIGLNQYRVEDTNDTYLDVFNVTMKRINSEILNKVKIDEEKIYYGQSLMGEWESGWDFSPRFGLRSKEYVMVDLNSNLYMYEKNFEYFYDLLEYSDKSKYYEKLSVERKEKMDTYLYDLETGIYNDYNFLTKSLSKVVHAGSFSPYFANIYGQDKALKGLDYLNKNLNMQYGIVATNYKGQETYQWSYPNGWAPLQFIAYKSFNNYQLETKATDLAVKYLNLISNNFIETNSLWEKYNVISGTTNTTNEYGLPEMMGWTAGVFKYFLNEIKNKRRR